MGTETMELVAAIPHNPNGNDIWMSGGISQVLYLDSRQNRRAQITRPYGAHSPIGGMSLDVPIGIDGVICSSSIIFLILESRI